MEQAIRRHLNENGYYGNMAKLARVRLAAVARPGWIQVYQFTATARIRTDDIDDDDSPEREPAYAELFGVIRDDARAGKSELRVFEDESQRREIFERWSDGLIRTRGGRT